MRLCGSHGAGHGVGDEKPSLPKALPGEGRVQGYEEVTTTEGMHSGGQRRSWYRAGQGRHSRLDQKAEDHSL